MDNDLDKHLYDMVMNITKNRIDRSEIFICTVLKGTHNNQSLIDQIEYAKEHNKPIYLLIEQGGQEPSNLDGADIHSREYFNLNSHSIEEATRRLFTKAYQDFPGKRGIDLEGSPNLNGIINWPPER